MSQTTDGFSTVDAQVEISTDGAVWTDISGFANSVKPGAKTRQTGVRWTHEGENAILTAGKQGTIDVDVSIIYTEGTADPFAVLDTQFETPGGGPVYVRWAPKGDGAGHNQFATDAGVLKKLDNPATDTEDAKPAAISFTIECTKITRSVIAS
jgi:hypothetical protein